MKIFILELALIVFIGGYAFYTLKNKNREMAALKNCIELCHTSADFRKCIDDVMVDTGTAFCFKTEVKK